MSLYAARVAVAVLAAAVAWKRPALRPVAVALAALAAIDCARGYGLPARLDVLAWCAWPGALAWLAVRVWMEDEGPHIAPLRVEDAEAPACGWCNRCVPTTTARPSALLALAWLAYACAVAAWRWRDPLAYAAAIRAPHVVAVGVAVGAWWWRRKDEGPPVAREPSSPSAYVFSPGGAPVASAPCSLNLRGGTPGRLPDATTPGALAHARAVAAVLAVSSAVDVVAGAWAGPWKLAAPVSWATVGLVAGVLLLSVRR